MNRVALWATCVLVLLPTTLVSLAFTLIVLGGASGVGLYVVLATGWYGIVVLWQLFLGLIHGWLPKHAHVAWLGLASGSLVSLLFMSHGLWLAGWPLIAAAHLGAVYIRTSHGRTDVAP